MGARTLTQAAPAQQGRQLPDHITSPGLSKLIAELMKDAHAKMEAEHAERGTTGVVKVTLDILKTAYEQLGSLHDAPQG